MQRMVWPPGHKALPPPKPSAAGTACHGGCAAVTRPLQSTGPHGQGVVFDIGPDDRQEVAWRESTKPAPRSDFTRVRVRAAHCDEQREPPWLLIEWPEGHDEPPKYWLSTLPEDTPLERMVYEAKMRWRIERYCQNLKQDLGLGQNDGRGWRGLIITPV